MKNINLKTPFVALCLVLATGAFAQDAGDAARGKELYNVYGCYGCHGYNGETGARDLVGTNSPLIADFTTFRMYLRQRGEVAPLLPSTRMPNYPENSLSDRDLAHIYAYVKTFKLNAPAVASTPTLQKILQSAQKAPPATR